MVGRDRDRENRDGFRDLDKYDSEPKTGYEERNRRSDRPQAPNENTNETKPGRDD